MQQSEAATRFCAAVDALHSGNDAAAANAWLLAFAEEPHAPAACESVVASPNASVAQQVFAVGVVGRAAARLPVGTSIEPLLQLIGAPGSSPQAVASLAVFLSAATLAAGAEEQLLACSSFVAFPPGKQLAVLHALAEGLAQQASIEELRAKPPVVAACQRAVHTLQHVALETPAAAAGGVDSADAADVGRCAALRCLAAWAECGVDYMTLCRGYPSLTSALFGCLDPRAIERSPHGAWPSLQLPAIAASVLRACLQSALEADEPLTIDACAPLFSIAAAWSGDTSAAASAGAAAPAWSSVRSLGTPQVDLSTGLSDGGGPDATVRTELACGLAAISALALELTVEDTDEAFRSATNGEGGAAAAPLRGAIALLLASTDHALTGPAEIAAEGWISLAAALPSAPHSAAPWRGELYTLVVQCAVRRCSRAHLRAGTGEDADDLEEWRERCAAPLLTACSELLGVAPYLEPLAEALQAALEGRAHPAHGWGGPGPMQQLEALEAIESLLFAAACTSGHGSQRGCSAAAAAAAKVEQLAAAAASAAATPGAVGSPAAEIAGAVLSRAAACRAALDCVMSDDADFEPRGGLGWASLT